MNTKRIAVFHSFLDNIGGAETVALLLGRHLPADVYTTNIDRKKINAMGFSDVTVRSIGTVPKDAPWRQQATYWRFSRLRLKNTYDAYIIAGDWAVSAAFNHHPNIWYVHSPMREIWDLASHTRVSVVPWYGRWGFDAWVQLNRALTRQAAAAADKLLCYSTNTQNRIATYFNREATIVPPPIVADDFHFQPPADYWLSVSRLVSYKRLELQLEAFRLMPEKKLIIVGCYEKSKPLRKYADAIIAAKPANVEFLHWVPRPTLIDLYARCRGFVATALDEDFGLVPLEAMASGKPVVAPRDGGYRETIIDGKTGILLDTVDPPHLAAAIRSVDTRLTDFEAVARDHACRFDVAPFIENIRKQF